MNLPEPDSAALYRQLYMIRRSEQRIIEAYPRDEMKTPMHMSMGQEAIAVAVCAAAGPDRQVFSSYRTHAAFLACTEDTDMFFAELYGKSSGTASGKAGSMHLADPDRGFMLSSAIVGGSIPPAVGAAFANQQLKRDAIVCTFFGDGAVDEGVFWESLNVASVMGLPILFICEDNGLAVHTSKQVRRGYGSLTDIIENYDCGVFTENSTDVEQIFKTAREAIADIRSNGRPAFLQIDCYRYLQHVGIDTDFDVGYRSIDEFNAWKAVDCVDIQRTRLLDQGESEEAIAMLEREIDEMISKSVAKAEAAPFAELDEVFRGVFSEAD